MILLFLVKAFNSMWLDNCKMPLLESMWACGSGNHKIFLAVMSGTLKGMKE